MYSADPASLPPAAGWLVLCDFDETFWAHDPARRSDSDMADLACLIDDLAVSEDLRFGFVTGSNPTTVASILGTLTTAPRPAFIGGNLGTDLLVRVGVELTPDRRWYARLPTPGDFAARVCDVVISVAALGIRLEPQETHGHGSYKRSYYLAATVDRLDHDDRVIALRRILTEAGLGANISHCNPAAGDPAGYLDVDIIPLWTGKPQIARYLQQQLRVPPSRTFAFGDSGNDLAMLDCAGHGWLVNNATPEARQHHRNLTTRPHVGGIVDTLRTVLAKEKQPC